jgi:hypothetical protein
MKICKYRAVINLLSDLHSYCHVYERLETRFGLVIGFIEHLQNVTTRNYSVIANSHTLPFTTAPTKSSPSAVFSSVVAWQQLPTADFPLTLSSEIFPCLSYQRVTATVL